MRMRNGQPVVGNLFDGFSQVFDADLALVNVMVDALVIEHVFGETTSVLVSEAT